MVNFSDALAVVTDTPAGLSSHLHGAFQSPADRGRIAACQGLSSVKGTGMPGVSPTAYTQQPVRKPFIYTTRVDAVGVKGSHPAREPV